MTVVQEAENLENRCKSIFKETLMYYIQEYGSGSAGLGIRKIVVEMVLEEQPTSKSHLSNKVIVS